ncbi:iron-siderophore ABC transporter substrate-binding protein [Saccharopolyspora thermophila]|uniref:Iron-siderophore ABC transporter substrate-binding protein n=1 Tax=Saccharopolyspora thermophila TaxID=89367 RepID=A0ABP3MEF0_9PSEU
MSGFLNGLRQRSAACIAALVLLLTACSGSPGPAGSANGPTAAEPGAFPATIAHKYGTTTVTKPPQRVVAVGLSDQDALLALGVVPVATTQWVGDYPGAVGPWARDKLGSAPLPVVLRPENGVQFERIAVLRPDLIVALYSGLTRQDYDTLSRIAPTIAQPAAFPDYGVPWQEQTTTIGRAVGRPAQAQRLVADVERRFADLRGRHPELAGARGLVATTYDGYFVYGPQDPRSRVLTGLGFTLPPGLDQAVGGRFGANISRERADLLDTDAIVWIVADGGEQLRRDSVHSSLRVAREGREVFVDETTDDGRAFSFASVLSLPYLLDRLTPRLVAALDGDPATPA